MSESDNESVTSSQSGFPAFASSDLPSQFAELVDRVEKSNAKINHVRKTVRRLKEKVAQSDIMVPADGKSLSSEQTVALGERFVERSAYKHQMKQIMRQLEEIREKSTASTAELREAIDASKKSSNDERIDQLAGTVKSSHEELSKTIAQMKSALESTKGQLNTAIKGTYEFAKKETQQMKKEIEELKKGKGDDALARLKKEMEDMKTLVKVMAEKLEQHDAKVKSHDATAEKLTKCVRQALASVKDEIAKATKPLEEKIELLEPGKAGGDGDASGPSSAAVEQLKTKVLECEARDRELQKDLEGVKVLAEGIIKNDIRNTKEKVSEMRVDVGAKIEKLTERATKIEGILDTLDGRFDECGQKVDAKIGDCEKVQDEKNAELKKLVEELKSELAALKGEQEGLITDLSAVKEKTTELASEDQAIRSELAKTVEQVNAAGESKTTEIVQEQNDQLSKQMGSLKEEMEKLQKSVAEEAQQRGNEIGSLKEEMEKLQKSATEEGDERGKELVTLKEEMEKLQKSITEEAEQRGNEIGSLKEEMEKLQKPASDDIDERGKELIILKEEVEKLQKSVTEEAEQRSNEIGSLKEEVDKLQKSATEETEQRGKELVSVKEEVEKLQKSVSDEVEQRVSEAKSLSSRLDELVAKACDCEALREELKNVKSKVDSMEIMSQAMSAEKSAELTSSLSEIMTREEKLNKVIDDLSSGLSEAQRNIAQCDSNLSAYVKENNEKHEQISSEITALKSEIEKGESAKAELQQNMSSQLENLANSIEIVKEQAPKKEDFDAARDRIDGLAAKLSACETLTDEMKSIKTKLDSMELMSQTMSAEKSAEVSSSLSEIATREDKLSKAIEDLSSGLSSVRQDLTNLDQKLNETQETETAKYGNLEQQTSTIATQIQELEKRIQEELKERLTAYEITASDLKVQMEQSQRVADEHSSEIRTLNESMAAQFTKLNTDLSKYVMELDEVSQKVNEKQSEIAALQEKGVTGGQLDQQTKEVIQSRFAAVEAKLQMIEKNTNSITSLEQKLANCDIENKAVNEKLQSLEEQGKVLTSAIENVKQEMTVLANKCEADTKLSEVSDDKFKDLQTEIDTIQTWMQGIDTDKLSDGAETVKQFGLVIDEMKSKVEEMENNSRELSDKFTKTDESVKEIQGMANELRDDYTQRMSDLEYVGSQDRAEAMNKITQLESEIENLRTELADFPRMINSTMEDNQIAMKNLSERIDGELSDMKSQLQQASFADEEIDELRGKFEQLQGETNQYNSQTKDQFENITRQLTGLKTAEQEHLKLWNAIKDLQTAQDVQANTVNPMFTQQISQLTSKVSSDGDEEADQANQVTPQIVADIEILRRKLESLEQGIVEDKQSVLTLNGNLADLRAELDITAQKIRSEMQSMRASLPDSFVELEVFRGLKSEVQIIQNATSDNVQSAVDQREMIKEQLDEFSRVLREMQSKLAGENPELGEIPEVIGGTHAASPGEINDLKMMINGIDLATQRQLRKLKRSIRKIEKMIEDAQEEERRLLEQQAKEEEQREMEEEDGDEEGEKTSELVLAPAPAGRLRSDSRITGRLSSGPLPSAVEVIQDDFQIFFVLMFSVLLYFLVTDIFRA